MTGQRRLVAPQLALFLTSLLLAGAGCGSGSAQVASSAPAPTTFAAIAEQRTTTSATVIPAPAPAPEPSSSTTTATVARRPKPTTSSSAPAPAARKAPATTTTTEWHVPAENLVKGDPPQWSTWTPPSDLGPTTVHNVWTPAPGVEMMPPYQAPTVVGPVEYVGCTRQNANNLWLVQVRATLTGGRYWRFPSSASGNSGIFPSIHQSIVGDEFDPDGFDGTLTYVTVETGAGTLEDVPLSPPLKYHCAP